MIFVALLLALAPRPPLQAVPLVWVEATLPHQTHVLMVKFNDDLRARAVDGAVALQQGDRRALDAVIRAHGLRFSPLIALDAAVLADLQARGEARTGVAAPDLAGMMKAEVSDSSPEGMMAAARALQQLGEVEWVSIQLVGVAPPEDYDPVTPDYSSTQGYAGPDPGIDALHARSVGADGDQVRVSDCEYGWDLEHEDLVDLGGTLEAGTTIPEFVYSYGWQHHGTAVLGEIAAVDNGYGVTGLVPEVEVFVYPEWTDEEGGRRPTAIAAAAAESIPGDVVLLEMQAIVRPGGSYCPAEVDPSVFTVVQAATAAGIVVVGAAGNGAEDLDSEWYQDNYLAWGDSGAILVGAGSASTSHSPLYFSTYGERVNLQGWGESVSTLGYGYSAQLGGDVRQSYWTGFSGTSSASPIVASAAAAVQDFVLDRGYPALDPVQVRELLVATGVPQGDGVNVGPLPDLEAAFLTLDGDLDGYLAEAWGGDDCDDAHAEAHPGAEDQWYDGVDGDCAGNDDYDADGDGFGQDDCDDTDPEVYPGAPDPWYDGEDADCAGNDDEDADSDGVPVGRDCDDANPRVHPGARERGEDGVDNDCDDEVDEGGCGGCASPGSPVAVLAILALALSRRARTDSGSGGC